MTLQANAIPRLAPGVRLKHSEGGPRVLLMPERILRLNGSSSAIVQLCDGTHTVREIAEKLHALYPGTDQQRIASDLIDYLLLLRDQRAIDF